MIHVRNLGPITDASVPTDSTVTAPSQSGKTTFVDAACLAIVGTDARGKAMGGDRRHQPEGAEEPAKAAEVSFVSPRGTITRRITASSKRADIDGAKTDGRGVAQWLGISSKLTVARLVLAPLAWTELYEKERGRPLRKALMSVLPEVDMRAEVTTLMTESGLTLAPTDAISIKLALDQQAITNRQEAVAEGRVDQARAALEANPVPAAPDGDAASAQLVLAAHAAHGRWMQAMAGHHAAVARLEQQQAAAVALYEAQADALTRWEEECGRVRQRNADATLDYQESLKAYNAAKAKAKAWDDEVKALGPQPALPAVPAVPHWCHEAKATLAFAERQLLAMNTSYMEARSAASTCPTCKQPWEGGGNAEIERLTPLVHAAEKEHEKAKAKASEAATLIEQQAAAMKAREQAENLRSQWGEAKLALGPRPAVPYEPFERRPEALPVKPQEATQPAPFSPPAAPPQPPEVTPDALAQAQATIQAHVDHAAQTSAHNTAITRLQADLEQAEAKLEAASVEAARVRGLVAAVRSAPSRVAARLAEQLGDLGPVSFEWGASDKDQAVEVLIDGRSWYRASAGRQRLADLWLRAALRRAAGLEWLPIFVDQAQDWSGSWPSIPNTIFLRTASGEWRVEPNAEVIRRYLEEQAPIRSEWN